MPSFASASLLDALDGVAYWTDLDGVIGEVAARGWREAAAGFGAPGLTAASVVGRNLFDMFDGPRVRAVYLDLHRAVASGARPRVTFTCHCDAAETVRQMRMTIGAIVDAGAVRGVLYHSQIVDQRQRPPLSLLARSDALRQIRDDTAPIVTLCGFCQQVQVPGGDVWVEPEDYYRLGGRSEVRLSHGVCPACEHALIAGE